MVTEKEFQELEQYDVLYWLVAPNGPLPYHFLIKLKNVMKYVKYQSFRSDLQIHRNLGGHGHIDAILNDYHLIKHKDVCKECLLLMTCNRLDNIVECSIQKGLVLC